MWAEGWLRASLTAGCIEEEMMSDQVSRDEIESLSLKLEVFAASLPDRERDLLAQVLANASESAGDTSGFASFGSPTAFSVGIGLGDMVIQRGISEQYFPRANPSGLRKE
jgi:hypothetical protein